MMIDYVLAVDIRSDAVSVSVVNKDGEWYFRRKKHYSERTGLQVLACIRDQIAIVDEQARDNGIAVRYAGVSVPGIYNDVTGEIWAPNIPGWRKFPIREKLIELFPPKTSIHIMADRCCCILGETWQGNAKGIRNMVYLHIGAGIYAGLLVDGQILRGNDHIAGAAGWTALSPSFHPEYRTSGFLEYHASGNGLVKIAKDLINNAPGYEGVLLSKGEQLNMQDIFSLLNPEKVIIGGSLFGPATQFISRIREEMAKWSQPYCLKSVSLEPTTLGGSGSLIGAARLAFIESLDV
jgi:glucokinase